jgi:hypothetical protein
MKSWHTLVIKSMSNFVRYYNTKIGKVEIHWIIILEHRIAKDAKRNHCSIKLTFVVTSGKFMD